MTAISTTSAGSRPLTDIRAMIGRELRRSLRSIDSLITAIVIPVSIMLVFVVVFGGAVDRDGGYIQYVVPGTMLLCAGFVSAMTAVSVAQDRTTGTFDRFKTLPIFGPAPLVGHVAASILRNLVTMAAVLGTALLLGFRPHAGLGGWLVAVAFLVLAVAGFTWISCAVGLLLSVEAAASINFVFLFLPYLSSGFVPVSTMPVWLRGFSEHQPYTPMIETLRRLLAGNDVGASGLQALVWVVGFIVVGYVASVLLYRRPAT